MDCFSFDVTLVNGATQTNLCILPQYRQIYFLKVSEDPFTQKHKCLRSKTPQSESCCLSKTRNCLTQYADSLDTNVDIRPRYTRRKIKKKSNKIEGRQANLVNQQ